LLLFLLLLVLACHSERSEEPPHFANATQMHKHGHFTRPTLEVIISTGAEKPASQPTPRPTP
jgi:hypothetical protein